MEKRKDIKTKKAYETKKGGSNAAKIYTGVKVSEKIKIGNDENSGTSQSAKAGDEVFKKAKDAALVALKTAAKAKGAMPYIFMVILSAAALCASFLMLGISEAGIFFEDSSGSVLSIAAEKIKREYASSIENIKSENIFDKCVIEGSRAKMKDIFTVYTVLYGGKDENDEEKIEHIVNIYREMTEIEYEIVESKVLNEDTAGEEKAGRVLRINVAGMTAEEYASKFNLDEIEMATIELLKSDAFDDAWRETLYGLYGCEDIVEVALSQLGNAGGEEYWSWYGFSSRVEWCACFVSWCADQCGLISSGEFPKFASCALGAKWFSERGQFEDKDYAPQCGTIIFFDWTDSKDGVPDHVGIVEKAENGYVYTVEGNSSDRCVKGKYPIGCDEIFGYGVF